MKQLGLAVLAYLVPTFALGFVWHLVLFEEYYDALHVYRDDIIISFGFVSMLIQGGFFAWIYSVAFAGRSTRFLGRIVSYGVLGALLSWSFSTLAVAAKNVMSSVPDYLIIETGYTLLQWLIVAPLTALAFATRAKTQVAGLT